MIKITFFRSEGGFIKSIFKKELADVGAEVAFGGVGGEFLIA